MQSGTKRMVITLRGDRTCQNKQLSQCNVGLESKRQEDTFSGLSTTIGPYLLPDRRDRQKYLTFLQQVLPDLPRNGFSLGMAKKRPLRDAHRIIRRAYCPN
ncbi:hypothetical protein AVEN_11495-1 [Araneus ventricosus]|uniref:Uncharacterized protein n=1 Tax=Araneus ventricosus TaxID=182803 RepID=A0A4Y2A7S6_ARAVE|nr:hypothetical protein AVEN_11495-1 [Araneus ventricosus]